MRIILPTFAVYGAHRELEPLFAFREEGVLGVIRDLVLISGGGSGKRGYRFDHYDAFIEQLMFEYDNNVDLRLDENTMRKSDYSGFALELACDELEQEVQEMMKIMFQGAMFEVCPSRWKWLGADLLATVWLYR